MEKWIPSWFGGEEEVFETAEEARSGGLPCWVTRVHPVLVGEELNGEGGEFSGAGTAQVR
jgi:hypothetical protein